MMNTNYEYQIVHKSVYLLFAYEYLTFISQIIFTFALKMQNHYIQYINNIKRGPATFFFLHKK